MSAGPTTNGKSSVSGTLHMVHHAVIYNARTGFDSNLDVTAQFYKKSQMKMMK